MDPLVIEEMDEAMAAKMKEQEIYRERLSKKLAYLLRYGALKEGLKVDDNGETWVFFGLI
jgi:RNA:NAD 2'-phosphotransferase (TPT1/KptA family)